MKIIQTNGITNINELENSGGWYWETDYTGGDLYEAEELFRDGHEIRCTRLILLHDPDGEMKEPITQRLDGILDPRSFMRAGFVF